MNTPRAIQGLMFLVCLSFASFGPPAEAAGPYPTNMCAGTRTPGMGCAANDVDIAQVRVTNGVTSCVAGSTVDVALEVDLQSNANARYDIGVFVSKDGRLANQDVSSGGSADCAVYGLPKSPDPLADLNGNVCGDINKSNQLATVSLGTVSVLCVPDQNGKLKLPATITWQQNASAKCESPAAAWVEAGTPSKCNATAGVDIPIQVVGKLTILKETLPAGASGSFAFTATGATPASFSLTHGKQKELTTGALTATPISVTVTEALATGFDPTAELDCKTVDGGAAVATLDPVQRKVTVPMDASQSRVTCTFRNKAESRIRVVKKTVGGNGDFPFVAAQQDFTITTASGSGEKLLTALSAGVYSVTEVVPQGWKLASLACDDPSGGTTVDLAGKSARVDLAAGETVTCTFTNEKESVSGSGKQITLVARQCTSYTAIMANLARNNIQESLRDLGKDTVYASGQPISRSIEDANNNCVAMALPWTFTLGRGIGGTDEGEWGSLSKVNGVFRSVTTTLAGVPERDPAGNVAGATIPSAITIDLTNEEAAQVGAGLWVQGGTPGHPLNNQESTYGFGALRCAVDNYNGDNVESNAFANGSRHVYCYAYYVVPPPTSGTITVVKRNGGTERTDFKFRGNLSYTPDPGLPGENNHVFILSPAAGSGDQETFYRAGGSTWNVREEVPVGWVLASASCETTRGSKVTTNAAGDFSIALLADDVVTCTYVNNVQPTQPVNGEIRIEKKTTGGQDGGFPFQAYLASNPGNTLNWTMTTSGGAAPVRSFSVAAGTYKVDELVPSGWKVTSISCSDPTGNSSGSGNSATINLAAGETVTCTFTNAKDAPATGTIHIAKKTVGGDGTFLFTGSGTGLENFALTTSGGAAPQKSFTGLAAGVYRVIEQVPAGWNLSDISCSDPTGNSVGLGKTATINLAAGETVTCTFTNTKSAPPATGTISVVKKTAGGNGSFAFTSTVPGGQNFTLTTSGGSSAPKSFTALAAGTYTVTEQVPAGWTLGSVECVDPTGNSTVAGATATIALADGETVTCTYTNKANASVVVEKFTEGGDGTFSYVGPDPGNFNAAKTFSIATESGYGQDSTTYASVPAGNTISITETVPSGWTFTGATCKDTVTGATVGTPLPNGRVFVIAAGQQVLCTFNNRRQARLTIVEVSTPRSAQLFAYTTTGTGLANFSLADDGSGNNSRTFPDLQPGGAYRVTQDLPAGWASTAIQCSDRRSADAGQRTSIDLASRTIVPNLQAGESLTCTYYNTQATAGSISIAKATAGGDGAFAFANSGGTAGSSTNPASFTITTTSGGGTRALTGLAAGTYTITETVPSGWIGPPTVQCSLQSGTSSTFTPVANGIAVALGQTGSAVDSVSCTFDNTKAGRITIVEDATPDSTQAFAYAAQGTGVPATFSLTNDGTPAQADRRAFDTLAAGIYQFTSTAPSGWRLKSIGCVNGATKVNVPSGQATVTLAPGDDVTCTFRHVREGTLTITKSAAGAAAGDRFTFTGPAGIAGDYAAGESRTVQLESGNYVVTELVPDGWTLTGIACTGGQWSYTGAPGGTPAFEPGDTAANIGFGAGETVSCTFTNTKNTPPPGTINIVKSTVGGNGTFPFVSSVPGGQNFSLATSGGTSPVRSFTEVAAGTYTVTEQVPAGWKLTAINCTDPTGNSAGSGTTAAVNLAAGETVTCTFTNTAAASIEVEKVATGGDATFPFAGTKSFSIATTSGSGRDTTTFASIAAGAAVTITEAAPAGWVLTSASCRDAATGAAVGTGQASGVQVTPAAGQRIICTFANTRLAQLTVRELSSPKAPQAFAYTATGSGLANFSLVDDGSGTGNTRVFANLVPGQAYSVVQAAAAGWSTPLILCNDRAASDPAHRSAVDIATRSVTPNLQPGESLTCVFGNVQITPGSITVNKVAAGGDDSFAFANSGGAAGSATNPAAFTIATTASGGTRALTGLAVGTYTITETIPAGWLSPAKVQCSVQSGTSTTITPVASGATIALGQTGATVDSVSCTFDNTKAGRITIIEDATPDSAQAFAYTAQGTGVPASFSLTNDGTPTQADRRAFEGLTAGAYQFTVATPAGWRLTAIPCANGATTVNVAAGQAKVELAAGDDVTCTYRHAREGTISITKSAAGAAASDRFTFTGPAGLAGDYAAGETRSIASLPGVYTVTEVIPSGWRLAAISCSGGVVTYSGAAGTDTSAFEPGDTTANIRIAAGEAVACTFNNIARGGVIAVRKETVGGEGVFAFTGAEDFQIDTRKRIESVHLIEVVAGTHVVREIVPDGWRLTGLTCSGNSTVNLATATATIQIASSDRVNCVYTNEKLGRIEIVKSIRGESTGDFGFTVPPSLVAAGQFVLSPTVAAGSAKRMFENVATGEYAVSELAPPSPFALLSITCTDPTGNTTTDVASRTASVRVAPGETVSCSYLNVTTATLLLGAVSVEGQATFGFTVTSSPAKETITLNIETAPFNQEVSFGTRSQSGLLPQVYTLTALPAPPGWTFSYLQCASSSGEQHWTITGPTATVTLPDGETIRCYYFYVPSSGGGGGGGGAVPIPVFGPLASLLLALLLAAGGWFVGFRKRD